jgi:hypothetical protein
MGRVIITAHAIERYRERVRPCSDDDAREALSSRAINAAIVFGARFVRLGTGQRIALTGDTVITVLPAENYRRQIGRVGRGRYGHECRFGGGGGNVDRREG